jgi:hypothetical protein
MVTRAELLSTLLISSFTIVSIILGSIWKVKGWVDSLTAQDLLLTKAIEGLGKQLSQMHSDNQSRFASIEQSLRKRW